MGKRHEPEEIIAQGKAGQELDKGTVIRGAMSEDIDDADMDMLLLKRFSRQGQSVAHAVRDRMIWREFRQSQRSTPIASARGQALKDAQLNLKVTKEFRNQVLALAAAEGIPNVALVERAIALYATRTEPIGAAHARGNRHPVRGAENYSRFPLRLPER